MITESKIFGPRNSVEESEKVFTEVGAFSDEFKEAMGFGND